MRWHKLGRLIEARGQHPWMAQYTAMPQALVMSDRVRVYFAARSADNRPSIGYLEFDPERPDEILELSPTPVLTAGPPGFFDDNGLYPGALVSLDGEVYLYYMGRSNGEPPLYYMNIGLAVSCDGGRSFRRYSPAPVLGRSRADPWMTTTPWVLCSPAGDWRMWYVSGIGWEDLRLAVSRYHIKSARSRDGIEWMPDERVAIELREGETNLAAPTVWEEGGEYHMLYCRMRHGSDYRLGYASSDNGCEWRRRDREVGIELSQDGWDAGGMAYPSTFVYRGRRYLLYAGNRLGRDGIGLARLENG